MIIYLDELFLKNFVMTYFITMIAGEILHVANKPIRLFWGSLLSTCVTILMIIYNLESYFVSRAITITLLIVVSFYPKKMKEFLIEMVTILTITFLIGGIVKSELKNIYEIIIVGVLTLLGIKKYNELFKKKKWKVRNKYVVTFSLENKEIILNAYLDTGNFLVSSLLNEPVIVIAEEAARENFSREVFELLESGEISNLKFSTIKNIRPIFSNTINEAKGLSYGLKVKKVQIKYHHQTLVRDAVIIMTKEKLKGIDALIGMNLLEGGLDDGNIISVEAEGKEVVC